MDMRITSIKEGKGVEIADRRNFDSPESKWYRNCTYGLNVASQLELPELPISGKVDAADIEITSGTIEEKLEGASVTAPWLQCNETCCQISIDGIARYRIERGRRIVIDRHMPAGEGVPPAAGDIRLYLLGTAMGALLHQRHWLPLHVGALQTPSGVWAFTGHSGAGKSTLSAWLHYTQGWPMVSDDVAVIKPEEEQPYLYPGPPRLKLWKDALVSLGISQCGLVRDLTRADKYHLMLQQGFQLDPQPLRALVLLERADEGETASLEPVTGAAAFQAVMTTLYRPEFAKQFNKPDRLLRDFAQLASQIEIYRFRRPWALDEMETSIQPLLQRMT